MKTLPIFLLIVTAVACASALECKWLGTAPFCDAHPEDCIGKFDNYWYKTRDRCWTGYKVLCCTGPPIETEEENLNMGEEPRQPVEMEGSDPGLVLAYATLYSLLHYIAQPVHYGNAHAFPYMV